MTTPARVSTYLAKLQANFSLEIESAVYNGYLTELHRYYKDKAGKDMK